MIILGIDPGLARVGYGVIEVEEHRGGAQHLLDCGIIRGVLMMTLARFGVVAVEFPPMQIKQALTGWFQR